MQAFVTSHLDYGKGLLCGIRAKLLLNYSVCNAVRIKYKHGSLTTLQTYWKSCNGCLLHKGLSLKFYYFVFKCLSGLAPISLNEMLTPYKIIPFRTF